MRIAICLCLTFLAKFLFAQDLVLSPIGETFCKPGVVGKSPSKGILLDYTLLPSVKAYPFTNGLPDNNAQNISSSRLSFKLKAPVIYRKDFTLLVGFAHYREEFDVSRLSNGGESILNNIHDRSLKSSRLSLYMIKPINKKYYLAFNIAFTTILPPLLNKPISTSSPGLNLVTFFPTDSTTPE